MMENLRTIMEIWRTIMKNQRMVKIQWKMMEIQQMIMEIRRMMAITSYSLVHHSDLIDQKTTTVSLRLRNSLLTTCSSSKDVLPKHTTVLVRQFRFT